MAYGHPVIEGLDKQSKIVCLQADNRVNNNIEGQRAPIEQNLYVLPLYVRLISP